MYANVEVRIDKKHSKMELWLDFKETTNEITENLVSFRCRKQAINLPSVLARECEEGERHLQSSWRTPQMQRSMKCTAIRTDQ